jgi:fibrillarin-like pre-rRNA processing protein
MSQLGIREADTVLYLGAAHGYTATFVADMVGPKGVVFCVDFAPNVVRDLLAKCKHRKTMIPILADAKKIEDYSWRVTGCDSLVQDIAQKDQVTVFVSACNRFLKDGGFGLLSLKARSVDVSRNPKDIFKETHTVLESHGYKVVDYRELAPYERDHAVFIVKRAATQPIEK